MPPPGVRGGALREGGNMSGPHVRNEPLRSTRWLGRARLNPRRASRATYLLMVAATLLLLPSWAGLPIGAASPVVGPRPSSDADLQPASAEEMSRKPVGRDTYG